MSKISIDPAGKVVLVSGSNRGIGRALTIEFLERGAKKVYAGARDTATLASLQAQYGDRLVPVTIDVTNQSTINQAAELAQDVDILINNAGILAPGGFLTTEAIEGLNQHFKVNVIGLLNLTNAFVNQLKSKEAAAIINVSSVAGLANMPMLGLYSASKATVHSITQGIRGELANENILVAGVYPGPIDTDMAKGFEMDKDSPENLARNVVQAMTEGVEDIFPDSMSEQVGKQYSTSPKAIEEAFSAYAG